MKNVQEEHRLRLEDGLMRRGLRPTRQRELVYEILSGTDDHPSAEDVFERARKCETSISLATVYNCLETLVDCGLVNAVHRGREPTRYCANQSLHAHFHDISGEVMDIPLSPDAVQFIRALAPKGYRVESIELNLSGHRTSLS